MATRKDTYCGTIKRIEAHISEKYLVKVRNKVAEEMLQVK